MAFLIVQKIKQMHFNFKNTIVIISLLCLLLSCSSKNISSKYYNQNKNTLDSIENSFKSLYQVARFSIAFTNRSFNNVTVEIITDTLSYIYEFNVNEQRLKDTLIAYHLNSEKIIDLITKMKTIRCTWINNYDFYVGEKKNSLVFMSIKPLALHAVFSYKKYYILTYFKQPQYFDSTGKLLDKRKLRTLRKINGEIFKRINDKVCYTISGKFR